MTSIRNKPKPPPVWQYGAYLCDECGETEPLKFNASSPHLCRACGGTAAIAEAKAKAAAQERRKGPRGGTVKPRICLTCGETEWSKFLPGVKTECKACHKTRIKENPPPPRPPKPEKPWKCPKCGTTDEALRIKNRYCSKCNAAAIRKSREKSAAWKAAYLGQEGMETISNSGRTNAYNFRKNQYLQLQLWHLRRALDLDVAEAHTLSIDAVFEKQHFRCHACSNQLQFWGYSLSFDESKTKDTDVRETWYDTDRIIAVCHDCAKLKEWKRSFVVSRIIRRILKAGEELIKTHLANIPQ